MSGDRLLDRLYRAVVYSDTGISTATLDRDLLKAVNKALRTIGGSSIKSLEDSGAIRRAVLVLEGESE
jgi:hypothetical protein